RIKIDCYTAILRTFFERKGLTNETTNWLNVVIESHSHFNRGMAYDNGPRHPEADARARSTAAEVPCHVVRHDPRAARPRQLPQLESLLRLLGTHHRAAVPGAVCLARLSSACAKDGTRPALRTGLGA